MVSLSGFRGSSLLITLVVFVSLLVKNDPVDGSPLALNTDSEMELNHRGDRVKRGNQWNSKSIVQYLFNQLRIFHKKYQNCIFTIIFIIAWEIWFWDPWGNWICFELVIAFEDNVGSISNIKEVDAKREESRISNVKKGDARRQEANAKRQLAAKRCKQGGEIQRRRQC